MPHSLYFVPLQPTARVRIDSGEKVAIRSHARCCRLVISRGVLYVLEVKVGLVKVVHAHVSILSSRGVSVSKRVAGNL